MKTSKLILSILAIALFAILLSTLFHASTWSVFALLLVAGTITHLVKKQYGVSFFEGLAPEVWIPMVKEDFYPSNSFLNGAMDLSTLVNNDKINFAEAGADPTVMKNNTNFPIGYTVAADTPKAIELDYYDTDSTIVRNAVAVELVYDQRSLYTNKHKKALLKRIGMDAAYAYAPQENDPAKFNSIINLGANDSVIDGLIDLQAAYNDCDDDATDRNLVLCAAHMAAIAKEDKVLYKSIMAQPGQVLYDFKIWTYSKNPIYFADGTKAAYNAAFINGTHKKGSFSFLGNEVMKAQGTVEMFSKLKDPDIKGDKFNFQMRALVSSLRGKYAGAILK